MRITVGALRRLIREQILVEQDQNTKQKIGEFFEDFKRDIQDLMTMSKNRQSVSEQVIDETQGKLLIDLEIGEEVGTMRVESAKLLLAIIIDASYGKNRFRCLLRLDNIVPNADGKTSMVLLDEKFSNAEEIDKFLSSGGVTKLINLVKEKLIPSESEVNSEQENAKRSSKERERYYSEGVGPGEPITDEEKDILKGAGLKEDSDIPEHTGWVFSRPTMIGDREYRPMTIKGFLDKFGADKKARSRLFRAIKEKKSMKELQESIRRLIRRELLG